MYGEQVVSDQPSLRGNLFPSYFYSLLIASFAIALVLPWMNPTSHTSVVPLSTSSSKSPTPTLQYQSHQDSSVGYSSSPPYEKQSNCLELSLFSWFEEPCEWVHFHFPLHSPHHLYHSPTDSNVTSDYERNCLNVLEPVSAMLVM